MSKLKKQHIAELTENTLISLELFLYLEIYKTPPAEIRKAEQIKRDYFEEKKKDKKNKSK